MGIPTRPQKIQRFAVEIERADPYKHFSFSYLWDGGESGVLFGGFPQVEQREELTTIELRRYRNTQPAPTSGGS